MSECLACQATIEGVWENCPLCGQELEQEAITVQSNPYPPIPLRYNRKRVLSLLMIFTIIIGLLFIGIEEIWLDQNQGLKLAVLGIVSLWTVVYTLIRKRRNTAKSILYLLIIVSVISIYLDYSLEWNGWSTTYVIPVICIFADLALTISMKLIFSKVGDYILYLLIVVILGFFPALFLFLNWTTNPIPSILSTIISAIMFVVLFVSHKKIIMCEWEKRMQI
jgi:predicted nucleic acid-binding Zn ribbon protein